MLKQSARMLIFTIIVFILVISACNQGGGAPATQPISPTTQPTERKVLTITFTQEFDTLNYYWSNMWFSQVVWDLWNCWAWMYDDQNKPFPYLVTEIPSTDNGGVSADGKTITLHLRDDIKWSDGTAITANDFIFTWQMIVEPKNTVASTYPYDLIESVEAPDPQTVVTKFTDPYAPWESQLWHGLLPEHILKPVFEANGTLDTAEFNKAPNISCGPYKFNKWETGSYANFLINENWWGTKPKIEEIFFRFVPDDASQTKALQAGDADIGAFIPYPDVPTLKEAGLQIMIEQSGGSEGLFMTVSDEFSNPGLTDVRIRQAIAHGIDRDKINKDLHYGLTTAPSSFWFAIPDYDSVPQPQYNYDPERAKQLLDEAGWIDANGDGVREKDGNDLVVRYGTTIREDRQNVQAVIQQELAKIGIKVEIQSWEADTFFADYINNGPGARGQLDIQEWSDYPAFPDPDIYYWLCSEIPTAENPSGTNTMFICDEELDQLIQLQVTQTNKAERQKTFERIKQIFQEQVYWIGLWADPDVWAVNSRVLNVKFSGKTPFFSIVEWDIQQ